VAGRNTTGIDKPAGVDIYRNYLPANSIGFNMHAARRFCFDWH
jgi:hypothetical protein